jgi:hypothetical protein
MHSRAAAADVLPTKPDNDAPDIENRRAVIEAVLAIPPHLVSASRFRVMV